MAPQIALVSGSNQGIGLAVATALSRDHGYHVIVGSRKEAAGKEAADSIKAKGGLASTVQLDMASDDSIKAAVAWIEKEFGVLDVLVNNAAIMIDYIPGMTDESKDVPLRTIFSRTFETNVVGTACLTDACVPLLRKSELPRIVFVSSKMGSISEATNKDSFYYSYDYKAYDCSKAAVNMLAMEYDRILADTGAMINVVCPGLVSTNITNYVMGDTPETGATRIVEMATVKKGGPKATYSDRHGPIPW